MNRILFNHFTRVFVGLLLPLGTLCMLAGISNAQTQTNTGFYYPVQPRDGYTTGYHMLGGLLPVSNSYGGHFMSPSNQRTDPQTDRAGAYVTDYYHNGYDVMAPYGQMVYPITGGTVAQISKDGWTSTSGTCSPVPCTTNWAVIMVHTTSTGQRFRAIYGHLEATKMNPQVQVGTWINAGVSLGKVGTWSMGNHLHFGISTIDVNAALPYRGQDSTTPVASVIGYGRIGINHWQGTWPDREGWVDPVFFIETNAANTSILVNDEVAKSDMKQYLVARIDSSLLTDNANFGFLSQDQNFEYRYQWFYKLVNGQWHWILVNHATYLYNRNVRYVIYKNMDTQQIAGWFQIVVLP